MSRGTSLATLRQMLKAELGDSLTSGVALANDARLNLLLSNKQVEIAALWDDPFLRDRKDVNTSPNTRFYTLPQIDFDRPHRCQVLWNQIWTDLYYGITEDDYNNLNSLVGVTSDPILKWLIVDQFNISPSVIPTAQAFTSGNLTGNYQWAYSFVTALFETPLSPLSGVVALSSQNATVVIPAAPTYSIQGVAYAPITGINVYRTKAGGSTFYLAGTEGLSGGNYVDNVVDSSLGVQAPENTYTNASAFEVWPLPTSSSTVRFTGQRLLNPLVVDTDCSDIDDLLLVFSVAASELMRRDSADAPAMIKRADDRMRALKQAGPTFPSVFKIGEETDPQQFRQRKRVLF